LQVVSPRSSLLSHPAKGLDIARLHPRGARIFPTLARGPAFGGGSILIVVTFLFFVERIVERIFLVPDLPLLTGV